LTRRAFLERLGAVGGYSAVYLGMEAMGLLNAPPASAEPFALPSGSGRGRKVVILGAGIAMLRSDSERGRRDSSEDHRRAYRRAGRDGAIAREPDGLSDLPARSFSVAQ